MESNKSKKRIKRIVDSNSHSTPKRVSNKRVSFIRISSENTSIIANEANEDICEKEDVTKSNNKNKESKGDRSFSASSSFMDASSLLNDKSDDDEEEEPLLFNKGRSSSSFQVNGISSDELVDKITSDIAATMTKKLQDSFEDLSKRIDVIENQQSQIIENQKEILKKFKEVILGSAVVVPKDLSRKIKNYYKKLPVDEKWDLDEVFTADINVSLTAQFVEDVKDHLEDYSVEQIQKCCHTYFVSLRKEDRLRNDPEKHEQINLGKKLRLRRQRLLEARSQYVEDGEKELWNGVTQELMSDEEDGEGSFKKKSPPWRSVELSSLIKKLDERIDTASRHKNLLVPKVKRTIAESPMKRNPSKKVKRKFLKNTDDDIDASESD